MGALQLVEEGRFDLDAPARTYVWRRAMMYGPTRD
jgi:CubicO group peptidase (beta-lactamase class C family)